jgi:hypothetical protein
LTSLEASAGTTDGLVSSSQQILNYDIFVTTSSLNVFTSSIQSEVGDIQSYTSSLKAASIVSSSTQISNYYTFAETGSENTFYGNQTITGSLGVENVFLNSSSIYLNSNQVLYRSSAGGQTYTYLKSYDDYGLALGVNANFWRIQTNGDIIADGAFDIENGTGKKLFNSIDVLNQYTASLEAATIVSSSTQIQNYNLFAETSSANTFYGTQTIVNPSVSNTELDGAYVTIRTATNTTGLPIGYRLINNNSTEQSILTMDPSDGTTSLIALTGTLKLRSNTGRVEMTGSVDVNGPITSSIVKITNLLKLEPTGSLLDTPLAEAGMVAASSSYGFTNLYLFDGSEWKLMMTGSIV